MATLVGDQGDRIVLASEPPFPLGPLAVTPALRQVAFAGVSRTIEPRVMQVLVVLARARGEIVGRDELIARCWDGRIVGESAINRVVSLLRALAAETGAFEIETITKVGYRLQTAGAPASVSTTRGASVSGLSVARRTALASVGTALIGGSAYLLWPDSLSPRRRQAERNYRAGIDSERLGDDGVSQAIAHYEQAVRADPDYAAAWGALARALVGAARGMDEALIEPFARRITRAAERALRLDPRNADALLARAMIEPSFRNWANLERVTRQALALRPELNIIRSKLALSLANVGRFREALGLMNQVVAREPLIPDYRTRLGWLEWQSGQKIAAAKTFDWAYRIWPADRYVMTTRFMFLSLNGSAEEALRMVANGGKRVLLGGPLPANVAMLCARALSQKAGVADRLVAIGAIRTARRGGDMGSFVSIPYLAALGDVDTAFEQSYGYLFGKRDPLTGERRPLPAYAERWTDFLFALPTASMRADPRFPNMTSAIGLDAYWQQTGSRPDYRAG